MHTRTQSTVLFALLTLTLLLLGLAWLATPTFAAPAAKVQICHIPPGDPENFHTITIGENALSAHLAHGDLGGACDENCQTLCGDGNACTIAECDPNGGCVPADPIDCDDQAICTTDSCDPDSGCENATVVCDAPDPCTVGMCAPDSGECVNSPVVCDDDQVCNQDTGECEDAPTPCLCEALWNNDRGAPPLSGTDLSDTTCRMLPHGIFTGTGGRRPLGYDMFNDIDRNRGICRDVGRRLGDVSVEPVFTDAEIDACRQLLEDAGCTFP